MLSVIRRRITDSQRTCSITLPNEYMSVNFVGRGVVFSVGRTISGADHGVLNFCFEDVWYQGLFSSPKTKERPKSQRRMFSSSPTRIFFCIQLVSSRQGVITATTYTCEIPMNDGVVMHCPQKINNYIYKL